MGQVIEHVTGGPCPTWISAIFCEPLLREDEVRLGDRKVARAFRDAVPKGLQVANLLSLGQGLEPCGLRDTGAR